MSEVIEKTPWPATGIEQDTRPEDYEWGYMVFYRDGSTEYLPDETPSPAAIQARWGQYFRA